MHHLTSVNLYLYLGHFAQLRSYLPSLCSQGPQGLHLCSTYKLDKSFLETLMDSHLVFVLSPKFCLSSFV